jgi:hypothetical protein
MFEEIIPRKTSKPICPTAEADGRLPQSAEQAIYRLLKASKYAEDTGRNPWEFALTIGELRRDGVSENDLRWLVCRGYVDHATEVISTTANERTFDRHVSLRFCKETAFVITNTGAAFSCEFLKGVAHRDGDGELSRDLTRVDDSSLSARSQLLAESSPISNGNNVPKWDRDRRELRLDGQLVKVFKLPSPMQEAILMAFEEECWPPRIDDPLPTHPDMLPKRRLHDTIKSLNRNQKNCLVRFLGDGTGEGIRWEPNLSGSDGAG